jgi:hypothetical protein
MANNPGTGIGMVLLNDDFIQNDGWLFYIFFIISMFGVYDIISEIIDDNIDFFSKNFYKKLAVFAVVYIKAQSIYISSVISIVIFLLFPKVFFGEPTTSASKLPLLQRQLDEDSRQLTGSLL